MRKIYDDLYWKRPFHLERKRAIFSDTLRKVQKVFPIRPPEYPPFSFEDHYLTPPNR